MNLPGYDLALTTGNCLAVPGVVTAVTPLHSAMAFVLPFSQLFSFFAFAKLGQVMLVFMQTRTGELEISLAKMLFV